MSIIINNDLIKNPNSNRPHILVLGAGASRAAFSDREVGKELPLMNDLIEILDLKPLLKDYITDETSNFEEIYSDITNEQLKAKIDEKIIKHFSDLKLPDYATLYDRLVLSLRKKDAIFSFNW